MLSFYSFLVERDDASTDYWHQRAHAAISKGYDLRRQGGSRADIEKAHRDRDYAKSRHAAALARPDPRSAETKTAKRAAAQARLTKRKSTSSKVKRFVRRFTG
jgi:hypothetical protein